MITYVKGDATSPPDGGMRFILHICNTLGRWGAGFTGAISRRWPEPERVYRSAFSKTMKTRALGTYDLVPVGKNLVVVNIIAQYDIAYGKQCVVHFKMLQVALEQIADQLKHYGNASVHMPRIGCGLGGAKWNQVEPIVSQSFKDIPVFVYDYVRSK